MLKLDENQHHRKDKCYRVGNGCGIKNTVQAVMNGKNNHKGYDNDYLTGERKNNTLNRLADGGEIIGNGHLHTVKHYRGKEYLHSLNGETGVFTVTRAHNGNNRTGYSLECDEAQKSNRKANNR